MTTQTISGTYTSGIVLSNGNYTNPVTVTATGSVYGSFSALSASTPWAVDNQGSVGGGIFGIYLDAGGSVSNAAGGAITSSQYDGVFLRDSGSVENGGSISGSNLGVLLDAGGSVTNAAGGIISNSYAGVFVRGAAGTVDNAGSIEAINKGVNLDAGGTVSNASGGVITGGDFGVIVGGASGAIENAGSIGGGKYDGVILAAGGTITNLSGGAITGGEVGIASFNASDTVENAGTITGGADAVYFFAGGDTLIVDAGAVFNGGVKANGAGNILELNATSVTQTLTGVGSQFSGFQTLVFETGAAWTAAGSFAGVTTIGGFQPGDTLDLTGLTYAAGDSVTLTNSNVLEVLDSGANVLWSAQLESSSLGDASYAGEFFQIANDGSGGIDITVEQATTSWKPVGSGDWSTAAAWSGGQAPNSPYTDAIIAQALARVSILDGESFQVTIDNVGARLILAGSLTTVTGLTLGAGAVVMRGGSLTGPLSLAALTNLLGAGTVTGAVANSGRIIAEGGTLDLTGAVTGTGVLKIENGATLELGAGAADQTIGFAPITSTGATLILDSPGDSFGIIRGFAVGDTIDLEGVTATSDKYAKGILTVLNGTDTVATLRFGSTFAGNHFVLTSDNAGGTDITLAAATPNARPDPADRQTTLLAEAIAVHSTPLSTAGEFSARDHHHENPVGLIAASFRH